MIIFDLVGDNETHPTYRAMAAENLSRQYDFIRSLVDTSHELGRPVLSHEIIKALNFHAIACLHSSAGEYRPSNVEVGDYIPPDHTRVPAMMNAFVDETNRWWETADPVALASYVLWRLNCIHPFVNGNGRTARACCYYVLCAKLNMWLPGQTTLPELIRRERPEYVAALKEADAGLRAGNGIVGMKRLYDLLSRLLGEQLKPVDPTIAQPPTH